MIYQPLPVPSSPDELPRFLRTELSRISQLWQGSVPFLLLAKTYAEPAKRFDGLTVLADGTTWNPGAGAGVYCYYGGAWNRLG